MSCQFFSIFLTVKQFYEIETLIIAPQEGKCDVDISVKVCST